MSKSLSIVLPQVQQLARRPEGFSNGDLAGALDISAKLTCYWLNQCLAAGHIFKGQREGKHARYFDTAARAQAYRLGAEKQGRAPEAVAREAVAHLRNRTCSSFALAELCKVQPSTVDSALAPLVDAGKLTRVNTLRAGVAQFDYRYAATWVPREADFALCKTGGIAPPPAVSPVAAPAPGKLETARPPAAMPAHVTRPVAPEDRVQSGKSGGRSKATKQSLDRAFAQPQSLGWAPAPAETNQGKGETKPADAETKGAAREPRIEIHVEPVPIQLDATDALVCALNSLGEMVLDLGDDALIKFKPKHALVLTRFAIAANPVLEQMAQRGEL